MLTLISLNLQGHTFGVHKSRIHDCTVLKYTTLQSGAHNFATYYLTVAHLSYFKQSVLKVNVFKFSAVR